MGDGYTPSLFFSYLQRTRLRVACDVIVISLPHTHTIHPLHINLI